MPKVTTDAKILELENRLKQLKEKKKKQDALQRIKASKAARAADTHRKIQIGGLATLAGIDNEDKGFLLGAFIAISEQLKNQDSGKVFFDKCKARGDHVLADQAAKNIKSAAAQTQD